MEAVITFVVATVIAGLFAVAGAINLDNYIHHNGGVIDLAIGVVFLAAAFK